MPDESKIAGGPKTEEELLAAERHFESRIAERNIRRQTQAINDARPAGAARLGWRATPGAANGVLRRDPNELAEPPKPLPPIEQRAAEVKNESPEHRAKAVINAIGKMFVGIAQKGEKAKAWSEVRDGIMGNLETLVGPYGTLKDMILLARALDEQSVQSNGDQPTAADPLQEYRDMLHGKN